MSLIRMSHPDLPDAPSSIQSQEAFERIWKDKGWELDEVLEEDDEESADAGSARSTRKRRARTAESGQEG